MELLYTLLDQDEIKKIHNSSVRVLEEIGIRVYHEEILSRLAEAGAEVDKGKHTAKISEELLMCCLGEAGKSYILYGRDGTRTARFGYGDLVTISSAGEYAWVDPLTKTRRPTTTEDMHQAILIGDALEHVNIVGAMTQPVDIPEPLRDIYLTAELVKHTNKPTRCWIANGRSAKYILEIYKTMAGGEKQLQARPQIEASIEPMSPLQMPRTGMEILLEFTKVGLPVSLGPMVMASATGPATLAGTLAQENAEILAAIVITQVLRPGTAVMYGGIPHIMDQRVATISFGSPEQALMAVAMVQMAKFYEFPAAVNTGLTDSKVVDVQSGLEKGMTMLIGALAGGDLMGSLGIAGADQGASLPQLIIDNELVAYVKRILRGFSVDEETLAVEVIKRNSETAQFIMDDHTLRHFRQELWFPLRWDRTSWEIWARGGYKCMLDMALERQNHILKTHRPEPIDEDLAREIDSIAEGAGRHLH